MSPEKKHSARPALLVSYVYLDRFLANRQAIDYSTWVMDSGAFSAYTSGTEISLSQYIDRCLELLGCDDTLEHVFALDVIGDPEETIRNTERMWEQGVPAVPAFHRGSSWHYLADIAKRFPKIALGGLALRGSGGHGLAVGIKEKLEFVNQYFSRVWPKWVHGFGCCDRRLLEAVPFGAVDSTSWKYGPARYGLCQAFGMPTGTLPSRKDNRAAFDASIKVQIQWHLDIQEQTRQRFGKVLAAQQFPPFSIHLATSAEVN